MNATHDCDNCVTIESLDHEGRGIAHADGKVIFIEGALTGERVTYSSYRLPRFRLEQQAMSFLHKREVFCLLDAIYATCV
ncbi:MAG: 23S rRNA (uracil1939-C5)-methyltransferase [Gallionellaceae bacterium]|nr:MAG: 23S rRNA (uracil1939-C5)-methyltransferase [Gallionellaceae bacterium]